MDSAYLKKNVMPALTEALAAMAVKVPEDQVEFIGKYLQSYVERQNVKVSKEKELKEVEVNVSKQLKIDEENQKIQAEKEAPKIQLNNLYNRILEQIPTKATKEEAIDAAVTFLETSMKLPAAYYAQKVTVGETDFLKYLAAGPTSSKVIGVKLQKPAVDDPTSEEFVERQGASFEAFKVPEVPEEEPTEEGEEAPKKGPPPLVNLVIPNVMRDRRIKFFGIPKLGAYTACPFKFASYDHDGAVRFNPGDGAEVAAAYELVKSDFQFMLAFDSIGSYRLFQEEEIQRVCTIGNTLIQLFEKLEAKAAEKQMEFINGPNFKKLNDSINEVAPKIPEEEAAAIAALQPAEGAEPAPETSEFLKPKKDSAAALGVWSKNIGGGAVGGSLNLLQQFVLPLPGPALKLLYTIALFLNYDPALLSDVCGDPSWEAFKKNALPTLASKIASYQADEQVNLINKANQLASIKAYVEAQGLGDGGVYPSFMPVFANGLLPWLQKAIAAREAAITYATEVDKVSLEA